MQAVFVLRSGLLQMFAFKHLAQIHTTAQLYFYDKCMIDEQKRPIVLHITGIL